MQIDPNVVQWDDAPTPVSAPAPSSFPGIIRGAPKRETPREPKTTFRTLTPDEVAQRGLNPTRTYQVSSEGKIDDLGDNTPKGGQTDAQKMQAVQSLRETIDKLDNLAFDAGDNGGWGETGLTGSVMASIPGTAARDLSGAITSVQANTAFDKLQNLKMNSPNGGGLGGNTSDADMALLKSSVANLDQGQSAEAFFGNVAQAKRSYLQMLGRLDPAAAAEYSQKKGIRFDEKGNPTLFYVDGEDTREKRDPFGVVTGQTPPDGSGGGGFISQLGQGIAQGTGDLVEGAGDMLGLVANPANATINAATGANLSTDLGKTLRESLGLPENQSKFASAINQGGIQALTGAGAARAVGGALAGIASRGVGRPVRTLAEAMPSALQTFGKTPLRDTVAGAAAGAGAALGEQVGGAGGALVGALAGGVAGYGAAGRVGASMAGERVPSALMSAADDLGVTMLPADVGGTGARMATGAFGRTLGGIPIAQGAEQAVATAQGARGRIAAAIGEATDEAGAGQAARRGFKEWGDSSLKKAQSLDEAISVPADSTVQLANTRTALADVTRGMQSNPELSKLWANYPRLRATLEALTPKDVSPQGREAFVNASDEFMQASQTYNRLTSGAPFSPQEVTQARQAMEAAQAKMAEAREMAGASPEGGDLSWEDMRRFRSIVGEIIGQPGIKRDGPEISAMRKLYGALSSDMEVTAAQAGPKALDQFKRAQRFWRGREGRIDDVFQTLFGKNDNRGDDAVYRQINTWAKAGSSDFRRLAQTIRSMPKDEADTIRATLVSRMGNAKPARGGEEVFSPAEFSTQWNGLNRRAKSVLFPDAKHREALDKFSKVTEAMKRAQEFQNFSNSGLVANLVGTGLVSVSGPAGWAAAAAYSGGSFSIGKLLASPRFARMIASETRLRPEQAGRKFSEQLSVLATREPLIAADARGLQQYITQTLEASPMRAAAQEEPDRRREPPQ